MSKSISQAQGALLVLEEQNDAREIDISRMELANNELLEDLKIRDQALEESKRLLQDQEIKHKIILEEVSLNNIKMSCE